MWGALASALGDLLKHLLDLFIQSNAKPHTGRDAPVNADATRRWRDRVREFSRRIRP